MKCQARWLTSWNQDWGRNINNLRYYADDTTLMAGNEKELNSFVLFFNEGERVEWKAGLKLSIQ